MVRLYESMIQKHILELQQPSNDKNLSIVDNLRLGNGLNLEKKMKDNFHQACDCIRRQYGRIANYDFSIS